MGETLTSLPKLLAANKAIQADQRCVGWNALPLAHHALRVNNFASQHGATVHRELQNMHHLFATVHFHVRSCRNIKCATLRFLWRFVIQQTPKRPNGSRAFDGTIVDINDTRIGGGNFLPIGVRMNGQAQGPYRTGNDHTWLGKYLNKTLASLHFGRELDNSHARYYKVAFSS